MDSPFPESDSSQSERRKGKLRAAPEEISETTPLLGSSQPLIRDDVPPTSSFRNRRRLLILLSTVFLSTLGFCLIIIVILLALTYSYSPKITNAVRDEVLDRSVVIRGPDRVDVVNATESSVWAQVDLKIGVDVGTAIDIVLETDNKRLDSGVTAIRRALGRWLIRQMHTVTVSAEYASLYSENKNIANVAVPSITFPLTVDRPDDDTWLTDLSLTVHIDVTDNAEDMSTIAREAWKSGVLLVNTVLHNVSINGGTKGDRSWRRHLKEKQEIMVLQSRIKVPELPGLPSPGRGTPFPELADLVTLETFNISTVDHNVSINATASLVNPLSTSLSMRIPSLPFFVALSDVNKSDTTVVVTSGKVEQFTLTHPNITLHLNGTVPPLPRSSSPLLSAFLSAYLAGVDAPIVVGTPLLSALKMPAFFPAPNPKPQILRDVHIKNMRISLRGESVLASGTIFAHVVLPTGVHVLVDAKRIWPDVLVFDGEVPPDDEDEIGRNVFLADADDFVYPSSTTSGEEDEDRVDVPKDPLPSPLPPRAFARIRPDDWLPAHSEPISDSNNVYEVTAKVVDVPLEVLPGRDHLLRSFVSKVLFSGREGALAGVKGTAAVAVTVDGLPVADEGGDREDEDDHVFELLGLPFSGSVRVGRKTI
ncbi:uncharacterized protein FOMMEDRAFT_147059 [Fomitiporia mediterranea MF3/22]|uniref:uncharacterized protein n=1 Tax=Fomitiporia mediterranea (strain MF3/22) TaxID=694068 RepID=UPI00044074D5|nr:uncharacterized protein FOMMEDRAFT_147059 [Fomitiporia mediterranea MF3/22]EJD01872.1 hypothetical protein FOMMEDRAFT_147059 [Fomitiporia mediterranea MF3/22]